VNKIITDNNDKNSLNNVNKNENKRMIIDNKETNDNENSISNTSNIYIFNTELDSYTTSKNKKTSKEISMKKPFKSKYKPFSWLLDVIFENK